MFLKSPRFRSIDASTRRSLLAGFVATLALIGGAYAVDNDSDSWSDSVDNDPMSRAIVQWGLADRIAGDVYSGPGPAWFDGAVKTGGTWTTDGWVSTDATGNPALLIHVDRTLLAQDLAFVLASTDVGGDVRVDLLDA